MVIHFLRQSPQGKANLLRELVAEIVGPIMLITLCILILMVVLWAADKGYIWRSLVHH